MPRLIHTASLLAVAWATGGCDADAAPPRSPSHASTPEPAGDAVGEPTGDTARGPAREETTPTDPPAAPPATSEAEAPTAPPVPAAPAAGGPRSELAEALSPADPAAFVQVASRTYRGEAVVLYRLRGALLWRAAEQAAGTLARSEARDEAAFEACDEGDHSFDRYEQCIEGTAADRYVAWEEITGGAVWAWAIARVREVDGRFEVRASRRLFEHALDESIEGEAAELRVRDLDHDGEPEITAMFEVQLPDSDMYADTAGAMGYVLAWGDLHTQFRATRTFLESTGDATTRSVTVLTAWRVEETDADVHPDLVVTERSLSVDEDLEGPPDRASGQERVRCVWQAAGDIYACPRALGAGLFDRGALP